MAGALGALLLVAGHRDQLAARTPAASGRRRAASRCRARPAPRGAWRGSVVAVGGAERGRRVARRARCVVGRPSAIHFSRGPFISFGRCDGRSSSGTSTCTRRTSCCDRRRGRSCDRSRSRANRTAPRRRPGARKSRLTWSWRSSLPVEPDRARDVRLGVERGVLVDLDDPDPRVVEMILDPLGLDEYFVGVTGHRLQPPVWTRDDRILRRRPCRNPVAARIRLCGPLAVEIGGREIALRGRQARLSSPTWRGTVQRPVARDELIELLWPRDAPAEPGRRAQRAALEAPRRRSAPGTLEGRRELTLALPDRRVDRRRGRPRRPRARRGRLRARRLGGGLPRRPRRARRHRRAVPARARPPVGRGAPPRASRSCACARSSASAAPALELGGSGIGAAERCRRARSSTSAPFRESGHRLLMEALAARGDVAEALRAYEDLRVRLRDELGTAPGAPCASCTSSCSARRAGRAAAPLRDERKLVTVVAARPCDDPERARDEHRAARGQRRRRRRVSACSASRARTRTTPSAPSAPRSRSAAAPRVATRRGARPRRRARPATCSTGRAALLARRAAPAACSSTS